MFSMGMVKLPLLFTVIFSAFVANLMHVLYLIDFVADLMYFLFLVFILIYITSVLSGMLLIQHSYNCCIITLCMQGNFAFFFLSELVARRRPGRLSVNIIWA